MKIHHAPNLDVSISGSYQESAGTQMANGRSEKKDCQVCSGEGGWWETDNGGQFKNRHWRTCPTYNGTGKV